MTPLDAAARHMDAIYRRQRFIYDATRRYYLLGRSGLIARLACPEGGHVLEIGCGTAWNLIRAARTYPHAAFYGIDVSSEMLKTAAAAVKRAGLAHRVRLAQGDATSFDAERLFGRGAFDRIVVSYALSMIPGWESVLSRAALALGPQGAIHIVDFGRCERLPRAFKGALYAWLDAFSVNPREDMEGVLARTARAAGLELDFGSLHGGYAVRAKLARPA